METFQQIFPLGEANIDYAAYFSGKSYLAPLAVQGEITACNVTFEPGCRNNWHIHHGTGQLLICTAGEGWYQEEGRPARHLKSGDVVEIPAEVKHWHGATQNSWFSHIALSVQKEGTSNEWFEPVSEEAYSQLQIL